MSYSLHYKKRRIDNQYQDLLVSSATKVIYIEKLNKDSHF